MKHVDLHALETLLGPVIESQGYELVDVAWVREQGRQIFRITIDRKPDEGMISIEDCARVSHEATVLLDVHNVLPGMYHLEVSSPGEHRPLKTPAHFARFRGKRVKIRLQAAEGQPRRSLLGDIQEVDEGKVALVLEDTAVLTWVEFGQIEKAQLMERFDEVKRKP